MNQERHLKPWSKAIILTFCSLAVLLSGCLVHSDQSSSKTKTHPPASDASLRPTATPKPPPSPVVSAAYVRNGYFYKQDSGTYSAVSTWSPGSRFSGVNGSTASTVQLGRLHFQCPEGDLPLICLDQEGTRALTIHSSDRLEVGFLPYRDPAEYRRSYAASFQGIGGCQSWQAKSSGYCYWFTAALNSDDDPCTHSEGRLGTYDELEEAKYKFLGRSVMGFTSGNLDYCLLAADGHNQYWRPYRMLTQTITGWPKNSGRRCSAVRRSMYIAFCKGGAINL